MVSNTERGRAFQLLCRGTLKRHLTATLIWKFRWRADVGGYYPKFVKRRVAGIGHADEHIWEMKITRLQADACVRRGAIPPLSSDFSR
jgi:hypothetical protein